jgi:hypothetical protein
MNLKLQFIAPTTEQNPKATVHISGKLGFNREAQNILNLTESSAIAFARNEADEDDDNLYAIVYDSQQEGAFKISKAGEYFNVGTKMMFDNMGVDYRSTRVIYDIVKWDYEGQKIYKMIKRTKKKKKKGMPNT